MGIFDSYSAPAGVSKEKSETLDEYPAEDSLNAGKLYDPYEGITGAVRSRKGVTLRLPQEPEFLFVEQASQRRRSWSENLCYYTGVGYGIGALSGASYGFYQLTSDKPEIAIDSNRVRLNRFLNMTGRNGRTFANTFGILGLFFAIFESSLTYYIEPHMPASLGTIGAGFATGALFRSTRGPKAAAISGVVGAMSASVLLMGRRFISGL